MVVTAEVELSHQRVVGGERNRNEKGNHKGLDCMRPTGGLTFYPKEADDLPVTEALGLQARRGEVVKL